MTRVLRKAIDWIVGVTLIFLGVLGGFIPFLPGWVLVFAGLTVLSSHSRLARAIHLRLKEAGRHLRDKIRTRSGTDQDSR